MKAKFEKIYKANYGKLVSSLLSYFGLSQISLAEDLVQETFVAALGAWEKEWPDHPEAWLFSVCKNKTISHLKKQGNRRQHIQSVYENHPLIDYQIEQVFLEHEINNHFLRLIFALCHPALSEKMQIVLILKYLLGFKVRQIAYLLGSHEEGVKKTLLRGRKKMKTEGIHLHTPFVFQIQTRLQSVHQSIYLLFSEGYYSGKGKALINQALCWDAVALAKLLQEESINNSVTHALLALMYFNLSRLPSRMGQREMIIDLASQNRDLWDQNLIQLGFYHLRASKRGKVLSRYHIEAGISSVHCISPNFESTDWCMVLRYYDQLVALSDSPFFQVNRCIAMAYCLGFSEALAEMEQLHLSNALERYHLFHITKGKFLRQLGKNRQALACFNQAFAHANHPEERDYIRALMEDF
ncbi:MAG: sigma-70 family RNA polymerase sigma factor [Bacteroidota bacterium]